MLDRSAIEYSGRLEHQLAASSMRRSRIFRPVSGVGFTSNESNSCYSVFRAFLKVLAFLGCARESAASDF